MRVVNGSLVVCLSDYQSICISSIIAVYWLVPRICRRNNISMKSIDNFDILFSYSNLQARQTAAPFHYA